MASRIELPPRSVKVGADVWDIVVPSAGLELTALILSRLLGQSPKTSALLTILGALAGAGLGASGAVSIKDLLGGEAGKEPAAGKVPAAAGKPSVGVVVSPGTRQIAKTVAEQHLAERDLAEAESEGGSGWRTAGLLGGRLAGGLGGLGLGHLWGSKNIGPVFSKHDATKLERLITGLGPIIDGTSEFLRDAWSDLTKNSRGQLSLAQIYLGQAKDHLTAAHKWAEKPELSTGKGLGTIKAIKNLRDAQAALDNAFDALASVGAIGEDRRRALRQLRDGISEIGEALNLTRASVFQRILRRGRAIGIGTGVGTGVGGTAAAALLGLFSGPRKE